jgi:hypothetical protein
VLSVTVLDLFTGPVPGGHRPPLKKRR